MEKARPPANPSDTAISGTLFTPRLHASRPTRAEKLLTEPSMLHPLPHVEVAMGIQHAGFVAWQSCQQLQIVKLPPSVMSLEDGTFQGCYVLREVAAPRCDSRRVFAECCSLGRVGSHETDDSNVRIYSTEERRLHTTCLETAKKAMESFGLFE